MRPNLPDENDNIFMECAFASNSDYLITSNQLESVSILESRLSNKSINNLKKKARNIISKVPSRVVPHWDKIINYRYERL